MCDRGGKLEQLNTDERKTEVAKPHSGPGSKTRSLFVAGLSAAVLAPALMASPAQAHSDDYKGDPDFTGPSTKPISDDLNDASNKGTKNSTMYGAYIGTGGVIDGKRIWCADPGLDWPLATAFDKNSKSDVNAPNLAYVLWKYDKKRSDKADQMAWDMAIASYLKQSPEIDHRNILTKAKGVGTPKEITDRIGWDSGSKNIKAIGQEKFDKTVVPNAQKHYNEIVKDAKAKTSSVSKAGVKIDGNKVTVTATNADGKAVSGKTAKVSLSNATFANGKSSAEFKTGDKAKTYTISVSKAGVVKANVEIADAKTPSDVTRWRPKDWTDERGKNNDTTDKADGYNRYSIQDMIERKPGTPVKASTQVENKNRPSVVTTINDKDLQAGDQVYDNFTVKGLVGKDTVDVKHELYWSPTPVEQSAEKPKSAAKVGEVTSTGVGNGDHKTDTVTISDDFEGGYFYWRESIDESETTEAWESDHGIPDETGFIPYTPEGATTLSENSTEALPVKVTDEGRISGGMPGQELTVSLEAFKDDDCTVEQSPEIPEGAESLGVTNIKVVLDENGEGTYTTNALELVKDLVGEGECGAVTLVETIAKTEYSEATTSDYGIPDESINIEIPKKETPPAPDEPAPDEPAPDKPAPDQPAPDQPAPDQPKAEGPSVHTGAEAQKDMTPFWIGGGLLLAAAGGTTIYILRKRRFNLGGADED